MSDSAAPPLAANSCAEGPHSLLPQDQDHPIQGLPGGSARCSGHGTGFPSALPHRLRPVGRGSRLQPGAKRSASRSLPLTSPLLSPVFPGSERHLALPQPQGGGMEQPGPKQLPPPGPARRERAGEELPGAGGQVQPGKERGGGGRWCTGPLSSAAGLRPLPGALGVQPVPVLVRKRVRRDGRRRERAWLLPPLLSPLPPPAQPPQPPPPRQPPARFSPGREKSSRLPGSGGSARIPVATGSRRWPRRRGTARLADTRESPRTGPRPLSRQATGPRRAAHRGSTSPPPPPNPRPGPEPPPPPAGPPRALGAGTSRRHRPLKAAFFPVRSVLCRQGNNLKMRCNCFLH